VPAPGTADAYSQIASAFLFVKRDDMRREADSVYQEAFGVILGQNKLSHLCGCPGKRFESGYKIGIWQKPYIKQQVGFLRHPVFIAE